MKIQIKDLKPNPFRDMKNYPIDSKKISSLTNSINQTGFWDNILGRKNNGYVEIAYGHHRLVVLKKIKKPNDYVDIPVKDLDDSTMIKIMANENMYAWGTNTIIIDETIRITNKYLLKHPKIVNDLINQFIKSGRPSYRYEIPAKVISKFLGSELWYKERVSESLRRLKLEKEGELDKEAVEELPHEKAAQIFTRQVESIKNTTPGQQKRAVKRIIEEQDFSESGIKNALLEEKYEDVKTEKSEREKERIKARDFVHSLAKDLERINDRIEQLIKRKNEPNFDVYENCIEAEEFTCEVKKFIKNLKILGGK